MGVMRRASSTAALLKKMKRAALSAIGLAAFLVNPGAIVKFVAADEENLEILGGAAFEEIGGETFLA